MTPDMLQLSVGLGLVLLVIARGVTSQQLEQFVNNDLMGKSESDWPVGDPRRCQELSRLTNFNVKRFEVLPGLGWDNLRNKEAGAVVSYNYSQCTVTDDGTLLIPDSVFTVPIKPSSLKSFAEMIDSWHNTTSTTSNTINVEAGLNLPRVGISGKFSYEHGELKSKQIEDDAVTTRVQLRYHRYEAKLQPDATLSPQFKTRLLSIAANVELNRTEQALYEGQLLVRDFGTHVLTSITAGAALVKDDYLKRDQVQTHTQADKKTSILASASASFFNVFHMSAHYGHTSNTTDTSSYEKMMTHSLVKTQGGPMFKSSNMTLNDWTKEVDINLIAMDRAGDPLYFLVTPQTLPELPSTTVAEVEEVVRRSVELYYEMNVIPGCTKLGAPNFSFSANFDDGSCHSKPTNLTFGGVYQTCEVSGRFVRNNPCDGLAQTNPKTDEFSCPPSYTPVQIRHGSRNSQTENSEHCETCWFLFVPYWCCHTDQHYSGALTTTYWCAGIGAVQHNSGYLFGGLYTSHTENMVTGTQGCPPSFYARKLFTDLSICISDDYEFGAGFSVPFGGFYSCEAGNPLSQEDVHPDGSNGVLKAPAPNSLRAFMIKNSGPQSWPFKCPTGYSQHLATDDLTWLKDNEAREMLQIKPPMSTLKIPKTLQKTWLKTSGTRINLHQTSFTSSQRSSASGASNGLSPGEAAGLSVGITLACVVLVAVVIVAIQRRRAKRRGFHTRLADETREPQSSYGSADGPESITTNAV